MKNFDLENFDFENYEQFYSERLTDDDSVEKAQMERLLFGCEIGAIEAQQYSETEWVTELNINGKETRVHLSKETLEALEDYYEISVDYCRLYE